TAFLRLIAPTLFRVSEEGLVGTSLVVGVRWTLPGKDAGSVRIRSDTGATEDAALGASGPVGTADVSPTPPRRRGALAPPGAVRAGWRASRSQAGTPCTRRQRARRGRAARRRGCATGATRRGRAAG